MICDKKMSFHDCELAILRNAIDEREKMEGEYLLNDPEIKLIIDIIEGFIIDKKLVCYGGTAINALLPPEDQFYDIETEFPDYDFFSPNAQKHAIELANAYFKRGFNNVEAKSGMHVGTYKVFVNFIPVADITQQSSEIFNAVKKTSINLNGILFASPEFLRMSMYLELSRPKGNISRWEKVLKRISLLNKNYPLRGTNCNNIEIQRFFDPDKKFPHGVETDIFYITRNTLITHGVVFFGAMAVQLYLRYLKKFKYQKFSKIPDFDVLSTEPHKTASLLKNALISKGIRNVSIMKKPGVGEIVSPHYEVLIGKETIVMIYKPLACHSYNIIKIGSKHVKIASIDTMLSLYLAFIHINRKYYDPNRILCMAEFLFKVQQKNRLSQNGILRRFSIECYGEQETFEDLRKEKKEKYEKLKNKRGSKEWNKYFLRYSPKNNPSMKKYNTVDIADEHYHKTIISSLTQEQKTATQKTVKQKTVKQKAARKRLVKGRKKTKNIKNKNRGKLRRNLTKKTRNILDNILHLF